jgi:hypothetical protein
MVLQFPRSAQRLPLSRERRSRHFGSVPVHAPLVGCSGRVRQRTLVPEFALSVDQTAQLARRLRWADIRLPLLE